jgi:hypothetical protein
MRRQSAREGQRTRRDLLGHENSFRWFHGQRFASRAECLVFVQSLAPFRQKHDSL